jgi:hypothetical protein
MMFSYSNSLFNNLWSIIENKEWRKVNSALSAGNIAAGKLYRRKYASEASCRLPLLSWAIWNGAPVHVLIDLLKADTSFIRSLDNLGRLPLHIACYRKASVAVIDMLVELEPRSVFYLDRFGNTALHYATQSACSVSDDSMNERLEVITALVIFFPETISLRNNLQETPVDIARHSDTHSPKRRVYTMLRNVSIALNDDSATATDDHSQSAVSSDFMDPSGSFYMTRGEGVMVATDYREPAACGERPQRRNASSNVLADVKLAKYTHAYSLARNVTVQRCCYH